MFLKRGCSIRENYNAKYKIKVLGSINTNLKNKGSISAILID